MSRITGKNPDYKVINHRIIIQLQALNPDADKDSMYELCKAYVRSKKPTPQQYEWAVKYIADWLEV